MFWQVYESKRAQKNAETLPKHVQEKYELWKNIAGMSGPIGLQSFTGFHDHSLTGQWKGFRSSYLNQQFRVIYEVLPAEIRIDVFDVNAHDYKRRK